MSTNCINCVVNKRTSARDCLCDACRLKDAIQEWDTPGAPVISGPQPTLAKTLETLAKQIDTLASKIAAAAGELDRHDAMMATLAAKRAGEAAVILVRVRNSM